MRVVAANTDLRGTEGYNAVQGTIAAGLVRRHSQAGNQAVLLYGIFAFVSYVNPKTLLGWSVQLSGTQCVIYLG